MLIDVLMLSEKEVGYCVFVSGTSLVGDPRQCEDGFKVCHMLLAQEGAMLFVTSKSEREYALLRGSLPGAARRVNAFGANDTSTLFKVITSTWT